jgi:hypothetical protein
MFFDPVRYVCESAKWIVPTHKSQRPARSDLREEILVQLLEAACTVNGVSPVSVDLRKEYVRMQAGSILSNGKRSKTAMVEEVYFRTWCYGGVVSDRIMEFFPSCDPRVVEFESVRIFGPVERRWFENGYLGLCIDTVKVSRELRELWMRKGGAFKGMSKKIERERFESEEFFSGCIGESFPDIFISALRKVEIREVEEG